MGYAELIERLQALPQEKQAEVFDFVDFLATRYDTTAAPQDWRESEFETLSIAAAMRDIEDDPVSYNLDDLRERWA